MCAPAYLCCCCCFCGFCFFCLVLGSEFFCCPLLFFGGLWVVVVSRSVSVATHVVVLYLSLKFALLREQKRLLLGFVLVSFFSWRSDKCVGLFSG